MPKDAALRKENEQDERNESGEAGDVGGVAGKYFDAPSRRLL